MNQPVHHQTGAFVPRGLRKNLPNRYDLAVFVVLGAALAILAHTAHQMEAPLAILNTHPVTLNPALLPEYGLRTVARMFAAILVSLGFTFVAATLAAKSRKAEMVIVPALDILQSVPILGFLTFTVVFFMHLFPGSQLGAECAAIFAIFTSQAWNMAFSFYQSLKAVPKDLDEVSRHFHFSAWQRFWRLEAPYGVPSLIWNTMMSMSGSWFFVVASEAITVGNTTVNLPGIGSYLALAIGERNLGAVGAAIGTMGLIILGYDQIIFRPILAWADKFRFEQTAAQARPHSWIYNFMRRTRLIKRLRQLARAIGEQIGRLFPPSRSATTTSLSAWLRSSTGDRLWAILVMLATIAGAYVIFTHMRTTLHGSDVAAALQGAVYTLLRVLVLIALASVVWVPVGIWIGLRPKWAERVQPLLQFLAAFPANVLFPIFVVVISRFGLTPDIWLSPLMILGTQWYILFNVIAGASVFPNDLREASQLYRLQPRQWWIKVILPGIFPYYITGALTASGGAWNASIVAEVVRWGDTKLQATGLGAYIADATETGDYHRVALGIAVMSLFVVALNRFVWRQLYEFAERRLRLE